MNRLERDRAAALAASVSAQRAAKAETERINQEQRNEPLPSKLELDGQNTSHQPRRIWIKPE
jgi:hypothetical protein